MNTAVNLTIPKKTKLTKLKEEFKKHELDITTIPITMDSWYVSEPLKQELHELGFTKIVVVGKSNYVFNDGSVKKTASQWKKEIESDSTNWGIDVQSPTKNPDQPHFRQS